MSPGQNSKRVPWPILCECKLPLTLFSEWDRKEHSCQSKTTYRAPNAVFVRHDERLWLGLGACSCPQHPPGSWAFCRCQTPWGDHRLCLSPPSECRLLCRLPRDVVRCLINCLARGGVISKASVCPFHETASAPQAEDPASCLPELPGVSAPVTPSKSGQVICHRGGPCVPRVLRKRFPEQGSICQKASRLCTPTARPQGQLDLWVSLSAVTNNSGNIWSFSFPCCTVA